MHDFTAINNGIILQGWQGHIDFYVRVITLILWPEYEVITVFFYYKFFCSLNKASFWYLLNSNWSAIWAWLGLWNSILLVFCFKSRKYQIYTDLQRLNVAQIVDQFEHKKYQKKCNLIGYKCLSRFFQDQFLKLEQQSIKHFFIT